MPCLASYAHPHHEFLPRALKGKIQVWYRLEFLVVLFAFLSLYMTTPELEAIRGQSSAASLPTGPVMADPFISPLALTIYSND